MGDIWMGKEHLSERRARTFISVADEQVDPAAVAVGPSPASTATDSIVLSFDRKDLWHELTESGLLKALNEKGRCFSAAQIRELVQFSLKGFDEICAWPNEWRQEMMRFFLDLQQSWADSRREPEVRRILGFTYKVRTRASVPQQWVWVETVDVRQEGLALTIHGRCAPSAAAA